MANALDPDIQPLSYAAFLRGINVGGRRKIKMADLRASFTALGFVNVKTVLASGNVRFDAPRADEAEARLAIEQGLLQDFGHSIGVIVRPLTELQALLDTNPFKAVATTAQTKLYVTFLPKRGNGGRGASTALPDGYAIVRATAREVCSVLTLAQGRSTIDLMAHLEKQFGKDITTRTWNTVTRLLNAS